ncbi:hypothetical protein [Streptomyces sp. NPDC058773]|uniref:hypothetical protein n=1 Tax=Streptomyces sp. NPDC058773 TaxID=3346632 RepID=UPI00368D7EE7
MHHVRRSAALTLLLLLTIAFGPLLCRTGGDEAWLAGRAATATAAWRTADVTPAATPDTTGPADRTTTGRPATAHGAPRLDSAAPLAVAQAPKRCQGRHAPAPDESAPLPAPHRGEPLAPATTGAGPLTMDLPAQCALARPPTDSASVTDPTALLPVLRI